MMEKPDVDMIEGLSPAISIEQKSSSHNPRSTVGTVTEIYDYLRLLFARIGEPRCPDHGVTLEAQTVSQMVDHVLQLDEGTRLMLLAPIVTNRKGEFQQLLGELHSQGYIRAIIDEQTIELDHPPALDKKYKHNIDVIVDRLIAREDNKQRLAESFETALNLTDGTAKVAVLDDNRDITDTLLFSSKFACPYCGYSLSELEPRLFSFNNPLGACEDCDGLGVRQFFDPDRIVQDQDLSLSEGAIPGWDRRSAYYYSQLTCVASHYGFDIDSPFRDLTKAQQDIVFFGSGNEYIDFIYQKPGRRYEKRHRFEGVINNFNRRYRETDSSSAREELAKCMSTAVCSSCDGSRLKISARNVFIGERAIQEITSYPVGKALEFLKTLKLKGAKS